MRTTEVNMDAGMVTRLFGEDNRYISAATNGEYETDFPASVRAPVSLH